MQKYIGSLKFLYADPDEMELTVVDIHDIGTFEDPLTAVSLFYDKCSYFKKVFHHLFIYK